MARFQETVGLTHSYPDLTYLAPVDVYIYVSYVKVAGFKTKTHLVDHGSQHFNY